MPEHHTGVTFAGIPYTKPSQFHPVTDSCTELKNRKTALAIDPVFALVARPPLELLITCDGSVSMRSTFVLSS